MDNILTILACGAGAFVVAFVAAIVISARADRGGVVGALREELTASRQDRASGRD
jgi:hypothetical protein